MDRYLFNLEEGRRRRDAGLDQVAAGRALWLKKARELAVGLAHHGDVTAEELRPYLPPPPHRNLWGAVFRGTEWEPVGFRASRHPSAHARFVRVWRLEGQR